MTAVDGDTREAMRRRKQKKKLVCSTIFWEKIAKTLISEVPLSSGFTLSGLELRRAKFNQCRPNTYFFQLFFEGFRRFPRVSKVFRRFPKGFQWFPKVSNRFRWFPNVLIFRHFSTFLNPLRCWMACMHDMHA